MAKKAKSFRPTWDDYFMAMAKIVARRASCDRLYGGAVLVKENRIIATGYNGSPPGLPHCDEENHLMEEGHCVRTIHAEHNVLLQAAVIPGGSTKRTTLYVKYSPCIHCCKYIVAAGVEKIVVGKIYRNSKAIDYLKDAGLEIIFYKENPAWQKELVRIFGEEIEDRKADEGEVKLKVEK